MVELTWDGKLDAKAAANSPVSGLLVPQTDSDSPNRFFIGDNLCVMKRLLSKEQKSVDIMYIDPPYNTRNLGNNTFIYGDDQSSSDWLNFMYPRIWVARRLLKKDGLMFISIDDREVPRLRLLCDEIFGQSNFIGEIVWEKKQGGGSQMRFFLKTHEYVLVYARQKSAVTTKFVTPMSEVAKLEYRNRDADPRGPYAIFPWAITLDETIPGGPREYSVVSPLGVEVTRKWRGKEERYRALEADNKIIWSNRDKGLPYYKVFEFEKYNEQDEMVSRPTSIIEGGVTHNKRGRQEWLEMGLCEEARYVKKRLFFDYPKPSAFIKKLLYMPDRADAHVMDFFAGSGTTAHAVWELNAEDEGTRRWTMVQLPESIPEDHAAYLSGYRTIDQVCAERLRRVAANLREKNGLLLPVSNLHLDWQTIRYTEK